MYLYLIVFLQCGCIGIFFLSPILCTERTSDAAIEAFCSVINSNLYFYMNLLLVFYLQMKLLLVFVFVFVFVILVVFK